MLGADSPPRPTPSPFSQFVLLDRDDDHQFNLHLADTNGSVALSQNLQCDSKEEAQKWVHAISVMLRKNQLLVQSLVEQKK